MDQFHHTYILLGIFYAHEKPPALGYLHTYALRGLTTLFFTGLHDVEPARESPGGRRRSALRLQRGRLEYSGGIDEAV